MEADEVATINDQAEAPVLPRNVWLCLGMLHISFDYAWRQCSFFWRNLKDQGGMV